MRRVLPLAAALLALASCGDSVTARIERIRAAAAEERSKGMLPLPKVRRPEDLRYAGAGKPDPFYPDLTARRAR